MTRLFALFLLCLALLFSTLILAQSLVPDAAKDLFALLVAWPRTRIEYVFLAAAWAGVFGHWWNKRRLGEVDGNFIAYLAAERTDAALSVATVVVIWAAIMGLISAGLVANALLPGAIAGGFAVGWLIDSLVAAKKP